MQLKTIDWIVLNARIWTACLATSWLFIPAAPVQAETNTPKFVESEGWAGVSAGGKGPPLAWSLAAGANGITVTFPAADTPAPAIIASPQWRVRDALAVQLRQLTLDASASVAGTTLAPALIDGSGTTFALSPRPIDGHSITWSLPGDAHALDAHGRPVTATDVRVPVGPLYLKELAITPPGNGAANVTLSGCSVVEDPSSAAQLVLTTDVLWNFDAVENWVDVHNDEEGRAQYDLRYGSNGTTITVKPRPRGLTIKLAAVSQLAPGKIGHARQVITHLSYEGPPDSVTASLGFRDAENEVLGGIDAGGSSTRPSSALHSGDNNLTFDPANVTSPYRGNHNGYTDFPISLDDYTLHIAGSDQPIKLIFHSADIQSWQPSVRIMGLTADRDRFVWKPGEKASIDVAIKNAGMAAYERDLHVTLSNDLDQHEFLARTVHASVAAQSSGSVKIDVDTAGLPLGVYLLKISSPDATDSIKRLTMIAVAETEPLPKASPGEFMFGMDTAIPWNNPIGFEWANWCGVDMIRNAARNQTFLNHHFAEFEDAVTACTQAGLHSQMLMFPRVIRNPDPAQFDQQIAEDATFAGQVADHLKSTDMHWYEIVNEPSLTFFFNGSPADYVKYFVAVRDAIKAVDPQAIVTVGGMPFAGMAGAEQRAKQIIDLMPFDKIDGFGPHGHGEGAKAERWAMETEMRRFTKAAGKDTKPYYDTETGTTSTDPPSWREQARTVVQKFAYAQSTHVMPVMLWFGFHPEWEWGILQTQQEPKPAALAYRTYVQSVRHLVAQDRLDLSGAQGEAYWFKSSDAADQRFVFVGWSDAGEFTRQIKLGSDAKNIRLADLFGNISPADVDADGVVRLTLGLDPTYLLADRPADAAAPIILPPALDVAKEISVVPGGIEQLPLTAANFSATALDGQIIVEPIGSAPITRSELPVSLPGNGRQAVTVPVHIADQPLDNLPQVWTVFAPTDSKLDLASVNSIPATLPDDSNAKPQSGTMAGTLLNLDSLSKGHGEGKTALCFGAIDADVAGDVRIGLSADYWMAFYVNGEKVLDTMAAGNGGAYDILTHVLTIHLKQGENLLSARVISGSGGWKLLAGGPQAVAKAERAKAGVQDAAVVSLVSGGKVLAREAVRITVLPPVARRKKGMTWSSLPPTVGLGHVDNLFLKQPDETRWYHGPADLSGSVWIRSEADGSLAVAVAVRDDIDKPKDAIAIHLATGDHWETRLDWRSDTADIKRTRDAAAATTWYEATIPSSAFSCPPRQKLAVNVVVDDDDWGEVKQHASFSPSNDPANWYLTWQK